MLPLNARVAIRPWLAVSIGADPLPGVIDIEVVQNVTHSCDSFKVALSLSKLQAANSPYDWNYWATIDQVVLDLRYGFVDDGATRHSAPFFTGYADGVNIDPIRNEVVIAGRDASALLAEQKISENFLNRTSSEIATILADSNGLTPDVTATTLLSGRLYEAGHVRLTREQSQWDLLTFLAEQEGFETYVTGTTLYFGPHQAAGTPFEIRWQPPDPRSGAGLACNAVSLRTERNLAAARGIEVTVRSWNRKLGRAFTAVRQSGKSASSAARSGRGSRGGRLGGGPQRYSFDPPDLDQAGVDRFADEQLYQLGQHEMRLNATFGAETTLGHHSVLRLTGTQTAGGPFSCFRRGTRAELHGLSFAKGCRSKLLTTTLGAARVRERAPDARVLPLIPQNPPDTPKPARRP